MTKKSWLALSIFSVFAISGCHVMVEPDETQDWWYYCDSTGCYECNAWGCDFGPNHRQDCRYDEDCPRGSRCNQETLTCAPEGSCTADVVCLGGRCDTASGRCVANPPSCKVSAECGHGYVCLEKSCKPGRIPCKDNPACGSGAYCSNGACQDSSLCTKDSECSADFHCDDRGSCIPGAPPPKTCKTNSECGSGLCLDGKCAGCSGGDCGGGKTCGLSVHCGDGRSCVDGQCTNACESKTDCASAQVCKGNVCVLPDGQCTADAECSPGEACLGQRCYVDCTKTGRCDNSADSCGATLTVGERSVRLCTPDTAAAPQCKLNKDCTDNEQCVNGVCRTVCTKVEDCAVCDDGPVCGKGGFCMTAEEANPTCLLNKDCKAGEICVDTLCKTL